MMDSGNPSLPAAKAGRPGRFQVGVRGLIVAVACFALFAWAGRRVWESFHPVAEASRGLRAPDPADRLAAAGRLWTADLDDPGQAIRPLVAALGDPEYEVRLAAAGALGTIAVQAAQKGSDGDAVRAGAKGLIGALKDREPGVRMVAAASLQTIALRTSAAGGIEVQPVIDALAAMLGDPDEPVRLAALHALSGYARLAPAGPPAALVAAMKEGPTRHRVLAIQAVSHFPGYLDRHLAYLLGCLEHGEREVRLACWWAFYWDRPPAFSAAAIPELVAALGSHSRIVRSHATGALCPLARDPRAADAIPALLAMLKEPIERVNEHSAGERLDLALPAARALGRLTPGTKWADETMAVLIGFLRSSDSSRRTVAAQALSDFGPAAGPAVPALIEMIRNELARKTRPAFYDVRLTAPMLGRIAPNTESAAAAVAVLIEILEPRSEIDVETRIAAIETLPAFGSEAARALPRLRAWQVEANPRLKAAAYRAATAIEGAGAGEQGRGPANAGVESRPGVPGRSRPSPAQVTDTVPGEAP